MFLRLCFCERNQNICTQMFLVLAGVCLIKLEVKSIKKHQKYNKDVVLKLEKNVCAYFYYLPLCTYR